LSHLIVGVKALAGQNIVILGFSLDSGRLNGRLESVQSNHLAQTCPRDRSSGRASHQAGDHLPDR
jgi:hypothetical protein